MDHWHMNKVGVFIPKVVLQHLLTWFAGWDGSSGGILNPPGDWGEETGPEGGTEGSGGGYL